MRSIITVVPDTGTTDPNFDLTDSATVAAELGVTDDATLAAQVTSASKQIADMCDRVFALQYYQQTFHVGWHDHTHAINLARWPVTDVVEVTLDDVALAETDYQLDGDAGLLYHVDGKWPHGDVVVLYFAGYDLPDSAPASLARATIELIKDQRSASATNPNVRSITTSDGNSVSYFDTNIGRANQSPVIASLIAPFKRYAT